jgi:hypothetical protein
MLLMQILEDDDDVFASHLQKSLDFARLRFLNETAQVWAGLMQIPKMSSAVVRSATSLPRSPFRICNFEIVLSCHVDYIGSRTSDCTDRSGKSRVIKKNNESNYHDDLARPPLPRPS